MNNGKSLLWEKSYEFALAIIEMYKIIVETKKEYVLSKQVLLSGTAIGALIRESEYGQSKPDFISKLCIALKEENQTDYWLSLLKDSGFLKEQEHI